MSDSAERRQSRPALSRLAGSRWLEPLQAAAAGALLAASGGHLASIQAPFRLPWWAVGLIATVVGLYLIRIEFRHDAMVFTLDEIALVLGLFFAAPAALLAGRVLGMVLARPVHIRAAVRRWWFAGDLAFAGANALLETALALVLFNLLRGPGGPLGTAGLLAAFAATAISGIARNVVIELAVASEGARVDLRRTREHLTFGLSITICSTGLALAGAVVLWIDPGAAWVLLVPCGLLLLVYHASTKDRARQDIVKFLYEATRTLQDADGAEDIAVRVLTLGPGSPWGGPARVDQVVLLDDQDPALAAEGLREAAIAPLTGHAGQVGVLVVADRVGAGAFYADELKLLETLANHTSVALDNVACCSSAPSRPWPRPGAPAGRAPCCCSTWTASRPSTTASATPPATSSWCR